MKLLSISAAACAICLTACASRGRQFPDFGPIPAFRLTSQDNSTFDSAVLRGRIWVADFMFTSCPGPCPRMTSQMHQVQEATFHMPDVRLVSFTVDPARDTPERLAGYAKAHHASPGRWVFLTGPQSTLQRLGRDAFKLNDVDGSLMHSTRFVLVDRDFHIRGYYDTSEADAVEKLVNDIHALAREKT